MFIYFGAMNSLNALRVSVEDEEKGLDVSHHGGPSYASGSDSSSSFPSLDAALAANFDAALATLKSNDSAPLSLSSAGESKQDIDTIPAKDESVDGIRIDRR